MLKKLTILTLTLMLVISNFTFLPVYAEDEVVKIDKLVVSHREGGIL